MLKVEESLLLFPVLVVVVPMIASNEAGEEEVNDGDVQGGHIVEGTIILCLEKMFKLRYKMLLVSSIRCSFPEQLELSQGIGEWIEVCKLTGREDIGR
jgi:hypothetical protein